MHEILAAGVQFLDALVQHKLGRDHVNLWCAFDPRVHAVMPCCCCMQACIITYWPAGRRLMTRVNRNVIGRIDPNMRKVRGLLVTHECKVDIWMPYDHLISSLESRE